MKFTTISTIVGAAAITAGAAALGITAISSATTAFAQPADATASQARTAHQDTEFLKKVNQGSVDEIDLAKLALKKSSDPDVQAFAQKMIDDHTKLIDDMKPFDMEAGVTPPEHPDASGEAMKLKLDVLSGKTFDKAYIKGMVEDHHKTLEALLNESKTTGYPAFKSAVEKGATVVRGHLEMIDQIAKKEGVAPAPVPSAGM